MKFGEKEDKDILAAMMDDISRRLDAMPLQLIVALQMGGESLEWKEQDGGGRGEGGGGEEEQWGGVGEMGNFVAQMARVDRFLRSVLVGRLNSGRHIVHECVLGGGLSRDPIEGCL
jgi:hypothetical protein